MPHHALTFVPLKVLFLFADCIRCRLVACIFVASVITNIDRDASRTIRLFSTVKWTKHSWKQSVVDHYPYTI